MLRSFDTLKASPATEEEDSYAKRKERLAACAYLSETVCTQSLKTNPDFHNLLAVSVAGLLQACDDCASDVRMNADECLNRMIKNLLDSHLGRLQVELYKTIKREETSVRTLKAALSKFADLAHLVKPLKRRVFVTSMLPSIFRIITVHDESLQETLSSAMAKICEALGLFFADADAQQLLSAFLDNLTSPSAVVRRCAADAAISVCAGASEPYHYMKVLLNSTFLLAPETDSGDDGRLGALLGFRKVLVKYQSMPPAPAGQELLDEITLERLYEMLCSCFTHPNHNIVTGSLETLQQLLPMLDKSLVLWMKQPTRCFELARLLASLVLGSGKTRVSIKVVALGCLKHLFQMQPATFRLRLREPSDRPVSDVISVCSDFDDPLLRGNLYLLIGTLVKSSLVHSHFTFSRVPGLEGTEVPPVHEDDDAPVYSLSSLCSVLMQALTDDAPTAIRMALVGWRACLTDMYQSTAGRLALEITRRILRLHGQSYWLVKTELLGIVSELDYLFVGYLEQEAVADKQDDPLAAALPPSPLADPLRLFFGRQHNLQKCALDATYHLLGDEDLRVREAAVQTLVRLVMRLFYAADWIGQDPLIALVERKAAFLSGRSSGSDWGSNTTGGDIQHMHVPRANFSRIVRALASRLHSSQDKHVLMGCYHALHVLSNPTSLPDAVRMLGGRLQHVGNNVWPPPLCVPDILPLALGHLKIAWMSLDLGVHADILGLVGNLTRDADVYFRPAISELLTHVMRVLNVVVHVIKVRSSSFRALCARSHAGPFGSRVDPRRKVPEPGQQPCFAAPFRPYTSLIAGKHPFTTLSEKQPAAGQISEIESSN